MTVLEILTLLPGMHITSMCLYIASKTHFECDMHFLCLSRYDETT